MRVWVLRKECDGSRERSTALSCVHLTRGPNCTLRLEQGGSDRWSSVLCRDGLPKRYVVCCHPSPTSAPTIYCVPGSSGNRSTTKAIICQFHPPYPTVSSAACTLIHSGVHDAEDASSPPAICCRWSLLVFLLPINPPPRFPFGPIKRTTYHLNI